ncbi:MAG TPA: hypothetical protein VGS58_17050 [Candidatus Sulfopaludibacter sp.]|nr:hypothetical protein [Candidatus Sulfopaludibacter sp.]
MTLDRRARDLRGAVVREDFAAAEIAAAEYTNCLPNEIAGLPPPEAAECLRAACALLEWSRTALGTARARMADDLRRLDCVIRYCVRPVPLPPRVKVDG